MLSIKVKIEDIEKRRRSAGLLHVVIGFFLVAKGADYFKYLEYENFLPVIPVFFAGLVSLIYGFARRRIDPYGKFNYLVRLAQVVCFTGLVIVFLKIGRSIDYIGVFAFVAFSILLLFSERRIFQETIIFIKDEGISIPGYYREHLVPWESLTEVVVREDFITLFHIKKKYLQYQVMQDLSTLEIAKMNGFCKERVGGEMPAGRQGEELGV